MKEERQKGREEWREGWWKEGGRKENWQLCLLALIWTVGLLGQLVKSRSLSLLLLLAVCGWVAWCSAVSQEWFIRFAGRRDWGREGETTPVAGKQQLLASWLGVLTPYLTSMGAVQPPLFSSLPGRLGEQGWTHLSASHWTVKLRDPALDNTGRDRTGQFLAVRAQQETWALRIAPSTDSWIWNSTVGTGRLSVRQLSSHLLGSQMFS